ncbi:hypothetical protein AB1286_03635 [Trinickia sp. NRRL B-1857]|uniref:hypothetical protein n=1 Tax=Trinickia sp. NRRL B-1857 TaxID=3162879 RepID=UPI003D290CB6
MNGKKLTMIFAAALSAVPLIAAAADSTIDGGAPPFLQVPIVVKEPVEKAPSAFQICGTVARARCSVDAQGNPPSLTCDVVKYGGLSYWPMTFDDNRYAILVTGYDERNERRKAVYAPGPRQIWKVGVDHLRKTVTFLGQGDSKATLPWAELAGHASAVPCQPATEKK